MTREEARKYIIDWINYVNDPSRVAFIDEPCSGEEILEAMRIGAEALYQPSLPSDLEEAAENIYKTPFGTRSEDFKAGAEWMAGQWWKEVSATDYPKPDKDKIYCVYTQKDYPRYLLAKVINHPNDDELLQWRCTQFPFTRYDMCEGDSYLEIRKK